MEFSYYLNKTTPTTKQNKQK